MKKKGNTLFLSLFLVSLLLVPMFASAIELPCNKERMAVRGVSEYRQYSPLGNSPSLGSAGVWTPPIINQGVVDPVVNLFTEWGQGNLGINIAKYIFLLILFVVIYGVADMMPFLKGRKNLQIAFSLLVSFLATAYITPAEIYVMLTSYTAMGMVIGSVIPFLIILFFSMKTMKEGDGATILMQYWVWIAFTVWMVYKTIMFYQEGVRSALWIHFSLTLIAVCMIVFNNNIKKFMFKKEREALHDAMYEEIERENILKKGKIREWENLKERLKD